MPGPAPTSTTARLRRALLDGPPVHDKVGRRLRRLAARSRTEVVVSARFARDVVARRRDPGEHGARVAVVIPTYGRQELTHALLKDIERQRWPVDVHVVDNAGDYERSGGEQVHAPARNLGWAGGCNFGLERAAPGRYEAYVLLNNDTRISTRFFAGLVRAWRETDAWLVAPLYDDVHHRQRGPYAGPASRYGGRNVHRLVPQVDGTCMFVPAPVLDRVGLLDVERFGEFGWGADTDYGLRVRRLGGTIRVTELAYLNHERAVTARAVWGDDYEDQARTAAITATFEKWGPDVERWLDDASLPVVGPA